MGLAVGQGASGLAHRVLHAGTRELGTTIDLHGGGDDLIFPHHECEAAQSEAATGEAFVRHWMHVGMVRLGGEKMSKSLGNLVFVHTLLETHDPAAVRLSLLAHHYRASWDFDGGLLDVAADRLERWRAAGEGKGGLDAARARLDDDLDTPGALAAIDEAARRGRGSEPSGCSSRRCPVASL